MTQATPGTKARVVPDDSTFGMRLAMVRQHMRWGNVAEAARECGIPTDSWRNWEEGMEPRRLVTIAMAIAARTGIDPDWLIRGKLTGQYLTVPDVLDPKPHPALAPRIVAVSHGDGRLRKDPRPRTTRRSRQSLPVALPAMA